jgi:hypothetical protein
MGQSETRDVCSRTWWHGSRDLIKAFEDRPQGLHFGSYDQARMRNASFLHEVSIRYDSAIRVKDRQDWSSLVKESRGRQRDACIYLNHFEGLSTQRISALDASGDLARVDDVPEARFRKLVPEAEDSVIVHFADVIRLERVLDSTGCTVWTRCEIKLLEEPTGDSPSP